MSPCPVSLVNSCDDSTAHMVSNEALVRLQFRTPPLRSGSATASVGSTVPEPPRRRARRALCCLSCAHSHFSSSSPSHQPLPKHQGERCSRHGQMKTKQLSQHLHTLHTAQAPLVANYNSNTRKIRLTECSILINPNLIIISAPRNHFSPRMKLYCASWALRIFLFKRQPESRSASAMKPASTNCLHN